MTTKGMLLILTTLVFFLCVNSGYNAFRLVMIQEDVKFGLHFMESGQCCPYWDHGNR